MTFLKDPTHVSLTIDCHNKWMKMLNEAEQLVMEDADLQYKVLKGLRLKERRLPPEVLGRVYAQYCDLINRMYVAYQDNVHLQREEYMKEIIAVLTRRMFELRKELEHLIVNDYIYVDSALIQMRMTPYDIQIVVPYHLPLEARPDSMEQLLQQMWADAVKRRNKPPKKVKPQNAPAPPDTGLFGEDDMDFPKRDEPPEAVEEEEEEITPVESVHTIIPEEYIQALLIQRHERYRQFFMRDYKAKCAERRLFFAAKIEPAPKRIRKRAAIFIQTFYREYMKLKRKHVQDVKRDMLLGLIPDVDRRPLNFTEETNKLYDHRRKIRERLQQTYLKDFERQNTRMIRINKGNQIDDITEDIREWFMHWYFGYGYFPQYPYELEGGTILVINGQYPTIEEQEMDDERYKAATKGKTKEQLKEQRQQELEEAKFKAEQAAEQMKKEAEALFKARCLPTTDPGYEPKQSELMTPMLEVFTKYRQAWSIYEQFPLNECKRVIYGYMLPLVDEKIMHDMHLECRKYVDELMRLELKLFVKAQQAMFKRVGWKYIKPRPRKRPKPLPIPKLFNIDERLLSNIEKIFDLDIMSRSKVTFNDVVGDFNYAAYDLNVHDPDARFPSPGYGDVRRRLTLSCVFGSGLEAAAPRKKAVMLVGPRRNGKSFLVNAIAGEMNAVKFDISPEVFSAVARKPGKLLSLVFLAAKVFQPAIIYLRDVERVFYKKVPPQDKKLKAKVLKRPLGKAIKTIQANDKVIFIATCSEPLLAKVRPMVKMFDEMILVPKPEYGSLEQFLYNKLQSIRSMSRDYPAHSITKIMEGFGFGAVMDICEKVLTPERIVKLNITPLSPTEFLEYMIENNMEPMTKEEYKKMMDFYLQYSPLRAERAEYAIINFNRAYAYEKLAKKKADDAAKAAAAKGK